MFFDNNRLGPEQALNAKARAARALESAGQPVREGESRSCWLRTQSVANNPTVFHLVHWQFPIGHK